MLRRRIHARRNVRSRRWLVCWPIRWLYLDLFTDVRYLIADDLDVERHGAITPLIQAGEAEIDFVSINFGVRYRFP